MINNSWFFCFVDKKIYKWKKNFNTWGESTTWFHNWSVQPNVSLQLDEMNIFFDDDTFYKDPHCNLFKDSFFQNTVQPANKMLQLMNDIFQHELKDEPSTINKSPAETKKRTNLITILQQQLLTQMEQDSQKQGKHDTKPPLKIKKQPFKENASTKKCLSHHLKLQSFKDKIKA